MSTAGASDQDFFTFYREYTHTGIHAASTAGLTAFGLLTFVHRAFVVLAIAVYVLPPIYLYLTRDDAVDTVEPSESSDPSESEPTNPSDAAGSRESTDPVDSSDAPRTDDATDSVDRGGAVDSPDTAGRVAAGSSNGRSHSNVAMDEDGTTGSVGADRSNAREHETSPATAPSGPGTETVTNETSEETEADARVEAEETSSTPTAVGSDDGGDRPEPEETEAAAEGSTTLEWTEADSPTDETLSDVVATDTGAYAVGTGGVVLVREDGWETVLDHGPSAESNALRGVDATDDGNAIWFAGDSGTLARYDAEAGRHTDHSAPAGITDNWVDVAIAGPAGEEGVHLVNGSGQVLAGEFDGSEAEWAEAIKPGSGSSMSAIEFIEGGIGYCCDTNSGVYETTDGREFERIGVEDGGSFTALAAAGPEALAVAAADGTVQRYDGSVWTPLHAAEVALDALSTDGTTWFAVGDGGTIRELVDGSWEPRETPVEANLHGVAADEPSVAVGAEGTILELRPVDGDG